MPSRRIRTLIALVALLSLAALVPATASAAEVQGGQSPSIPAGQTIADDVYLFGGTASVDGNVTRDLTVAAGTIDVSGQVGGNLNVAGGNITLTGPVGGSIRVAGGNITINGPVGWDVLVTGGTVELGSQAKITHDLLVAGGSVTLDGTVGRDVRGSLGTLTINGSVGRDVSVDVSNQLVLGARAHVTGNLAYRANQDAQIASGATVGGSTSRTALPGRQQSAVSTVGGWLGGFLLRLLWALVVGTVLVLLLPARTAAAAQALRAQPLISFGWGLGVLIVAPVAVIVLLITVIGVPVALLLLALYLAGLYLSQVLVGLAVGRLILSRGWRDVGRLHVWVVMLVGVTLVTVVRLLPLPYSWTLWLSLLVGVLGLGAVWTAVTGWGLTRPSPAAAPAVLPAVPTPENPA